MEQKFTNLETCYPKEWGRVARLLHNNRVPVYRVKLEATSQVLRTE